MRFKQIIPLLFLSTIITVISSCATTQSFPKDLNVSDKTKTSALLFGVLENNDFEEQVYEGVILELIDEKPFNQSLPGTLKVLIEPGEHILKGKVNVVFGNLLMTDDFIIEFNFEENTVYEISSLKKEATYHLFTNYPKIFQIVYETNEIGLIKRLTLKP